MTEDFRAILGVPSNASQASIRRAFLARARECHPDLHPDDPDAATKFKRINTAFENLYRPWLRPVRSGGSRADNAAIFANLANAARRRWTFDRCAGELVSAPAICLIVFGLVLPLSVWIHDKVVEASRAQRNRTQWRASDGKSLQSNTYDDELVSPKEDADMEWMKKVIAVLLSFPMALLWGTAMVAGGINLLGLRVYCLAVGASILAILPFCVGLWFPVGLFIGAWALARIHDPMVRSAFRA